MSSTSIDQSSERMLADRGYLSIREKIGYGLGYVINGSRFSFRPCEGKNYGTLILIRYRSAPA